MKHVFASLNKYFHSIKDCNTFLANIPQHRFTKKGYPVLLSQEIFLSIQIAYGIISDSQLLSLITYALFFFDVLMISITFHPLSRILSTERQRSKTTQSLSSSFLYQELWRMFAQGSAQGKTSTQYLSLFNFPDTSESPLFCILKAIPFLLAETCFGSNKYFTHQPDKFKKQGITEKK